MSLQELIDAVTQLEEDQSFFETKLGNELYGRHHYDLVTLGGRMQTKARAVLNIDTPPSSELITKITDAIHEYIRLIIPPKILGGYCPCLKLARYGPEYERRFFVTFSKVIATVFLCDVIVLEQHTEKLNTYSARYADYITRLNILQTILRNVPRTTSRNIPSATTQRDEERKERSRIEIISLSGQIIQFLKMFESETDGFLTESIRQLMSISSLIPPNIFNNNSNNNSNNFNN